ncbi:MAG: ABC transporter substrate-binding protein [Bacteroidales bacterium]|nr:ABC transporter substrate-binding protein [Bacteroidales bacterium]
MNRYIDIKDTLLNITEKYPETIRIFSENGFPQMNDKAKREEFGKALSLEMALTLKQLNKDSFVNMLEEAIAQSRANEDAALNEDEPDSTKADITISGLLPCPVRMPLNESLDNFLANYQKANNLKVDYDLKAASMGLDWLKNELEETHDPGKLADLFISAGFDLFFDENLMGYFKEQGVFKDLSGLEKLNRDFDNETLDLKDPKGHYSMIATVPAIFMVNQKELGNREAPKSWTDLLKPEFENSVSLPIGDFDLFNAILLTLYRHYGEDAVRKLGRTLLRSMHPSEMVRSSVKKMQRPAITIMPYFFTKTVKEGSPMQAVWPEDGAIISPIFMLTKAAREKELQPIADFFLSEEVGKILSHNGRFPSVSPEVENQLSPQQKFMWLGWDFIYQNDIAALIKHCEELFHSSINLNPIES